MRSSILAGKNRPTWGTDPSSFHMVASSVQTLISAQPKSWVPRSSPCSSLLSTPCLRPPALSSQFTDTVVCVVPRPWPVAWKVFPGWGQVLYCLISSDLKAISYLFCFCFCFFLVLNGNVNWLPDTPSCLSTLCISWFPKSNLLCLQNGSNTTTYFARGLYSKSASS